MRVCVEEKLIRSVPKHFIAWELQKNLGIGTLKSGISIAQRGDRRLKNSTHHCERLNGLSFPVW